MTTHKVVPREPTVEMMKAASNSETGALLAKAMWMPMWDAAPTESAPVREALEGFMAQHIRTQTNYGCEPFCGCELCEAARAALQSPGVSEREKKLQAVIEWALGEGDGFPDWPESVTIKGNPKYWWRTELRKRYDAALAAPMKEEGRG